MGVSSLKIVADLHTHTIASVHAYATITEMASQACENGLYAIAVTDHSHIPERQYFNSLVLIPEYLKGVRVLRGIEANICDYSGNLDADDELLNRLDWVVASIHAGTMEKGLPDIDKCTQAYLGVLQNKNVNVIGHSGSQWFKYDYDKVIPECARLGKLIEINDSAFRYKKDYMCNCVTIAKKCMQYGARICINTDAHFTDTLGRADCALRALEEIGFPSSLIVNGSVENLQSYFSENNISY